MAAQLNITLPEELAAFVRARVASGQYASESDVIRDGIEELIDRESPLPDWLRAEGAAAFDAWKANPSEVSGVQEVRARFEARWTSDDNQK